MNVLLDQVVLEKMPRIPAVEVDGVCRKTTQSDFGQFRQFIRPRMLWGWWTEEAARRLTRFYEDFAAGKRPKLALMAPPQTGKSWMVTDFIAWCAGKNPDKKTIFGSFSDDLGIRTNSELQHIFTDDRFRRAFPDTRIADQNTTLDRWKRNSTLIEFVDHDGSFRNTTVAGQINGMELHLGVIDDPLKGRAEAQSRLIRDKTWDWFADDFLSRFAKDGALLVVMCLTGDTQVSMADGSWKPLREVKVGDEVVAWSDDGPVNRKVTAFIPQGEDDIFELRTEGSLVRGNARHPFKVMREDETFEWVKLRDLRPALLPDAGGK